MLCCVLLLFDTGWFYPYPSGFLHWHWGNHTIAPVPVKEPSRIWVNVSCELTWTDNITTTKPCLYSMGCTLSFVPLDTRYCPFLHPSVIYMAFALCLVINRESIAAFYLILPSIDTNTLCELHNILPDAIITRCCMVQYYICFSTDKSRTLFIIIISFFISLLLL